MKLVKIFNFDKFDFQHSISNARFYLFIHLSFICIAIQISVIIVFLNTIIKFFTFNEYEFETFFDVMFSSSLNETWATHQNFFQKINKIVKAFDYAIVIVDFQKFFQKIKNKLVLRCNKSRKFHNDEIIDKRSDVEFKRIQCSFKTIVKLDENNKWIFIEIANFEHNHFENLKKTLSRHRHYAMTDEIKKIFKINYETIQLFSKFLHSFNINTITISTILSLKLKIFRITSSRCELNVWTIWFLFKHSTWHYTTILIDSSKYNSIRWQQKLNIYFFAIKFQKKCFCTTKRFSFWIAFTKLIDIICF